MPRRTAEELADTPLSLVYIAGNVADAEAAERWLTEAGIDYTLSVEPFRTQSFLSGEYMGLFLSVSTAQHRTGRDLLRAHGLTDTVELELAEPLEGTHGA
jgi:hypothetical protein